MRMPSGLLDAVGLVAAAALLADEAKFRLQRIGILDLALGIADRLGEACDVRVKAGLIVPDLVRRAVVAFERLALETCRKELRELLGGIIELCERRIDRRLIIGLFGLDDRRQRAGILAVAFHD